MFIIIIILIIINKIYMLFKFPFRQKNNVLFFNFIVNFCKIKKIYSIIGYFEVVG